LSVGMRVPKLRCHPDRSAAKWRDLLFLSKISGSASLRGFLPGF
jgi:hypothetical protein